MFFGKGVAMDVEDLKSLYVKCDVKEYRLKHALKRERWVTLEEANLLYTIGTEEQPDHIYESGTANGFSAMWLSLVGCPVTTFDPICRAKVWDLFNGIPDNITYVEASFSSIVERAHDPKEKKLFFIDGAHKSHNLKEDCDAVSQMASSGDVVVFHDLSHEAVFRYWHRMTDHASTYESYDTKRVMGKLVLR